MTRLKRNQVPEELKWDLSPIYPSVEQWEKDLQLVAKKAEALTAFCGRLGEGGAVLLSCFQAYEELELCFERVYMYAYLHQMEDATSSHSQSMMGMIRAINVQVKTAKTSITSEILSLPEGMVQQELELEPKLQSFKHQLLKIISERPHRLSANGEALLAALEPTLHTQNSLYQTMVTADMKCESVLDPNGKEEPVSIDRYLFHLSTLPDREIRKQAYRSLTKGIGLYKQSIATNYSNHIRKNVALAKLRNYDSAIEMFLKPQQIPVSFYKTALAVIMEEAKPIARRYAALQKRLIGTDKISVYDLHAPLSTEESEITYEEAANLIKTGLSPLGEEYGQILATAFQDRWIDRADNIGKFPIPCSYRFYGVHPYVLTIWNNRMSDTLILAHELGHTVHNELTSRNQRIGDANYEILFAEVASTTNEWLLYHYLASSGDPQLRLQAARHLIEFDFSYFMGEMFLIEKLQAHMYDRVEQKLSLSSQVIYDTYANSLQELFGDEVELDEEAGFLWTFYPHPLMQTLYPYCYSVALCASAAIVDAILTEGNVAVERYLSALKAGGTLPPLELMKLAGVDMENPEVLRNGIRRFGKVLEELEKTLS